jgi:hypothetical protein
MNKASIPPPTPTPTPIAVASFETLSLLPELLYHELAGWCVGATVGDAVGVNAEDDPCSLYSTVPHEFTIRDRPKLIVGVESTLEAVLLNCQYSAPSTTKVRYTTVQQHSVS